MKKSRAGIAFPRYFTSRLEPGKTPYEDVQWETRTASIGNDKGSVIFEQRDIEVPVDWSQTATNIVASKYFYGKMGSPERETSLAQLVERVVNTIADWGKKDGYFHTDAMHVVERLWKDGDNMVWQATVEEPNVLAKPWVMPARLLRPSTDSLEESPRCVESDGAKLLNDDHHLQR